MNTPDISLIHTITQVAADQEMGGVPVPHCYDQGITIVIKYYLILSSFSQVSIPSLPSHLYPSRAGYGSTNSRCLNSAPTKYSINSGYAQSFMPGTTPPQLFTGSPTVFSDTQAINN